MTITRNPLLSVGADAAIGRVLGKLRTDLCVIQRRSNGVDAGGAPVGTYTDLPAIECRVAPSGRVATERIFGQRFGPEMDYIIHLPRDIIVQSDDRIVASGATLQVVSGDSIKSHGNELLVAVKAST